MYYKHDDNEFVQKPMVNGSSSARFVACPKRLDNGTSSDEFLLYSVDTHGSGGVR